MSKPSNNKNSTTEMHNKHMRDIADRIANLRTDRNMSQDTLLKQLSSCYKTDIPINISKSSYNRLEKDSRSMSIETLLVLCEYYNVSPNFILYGDTDSGIAFKYLFSKDTAQQLCSLLEYLIQILRLKFNIK